VTYDPLVAVGDAQRLALLRSTGLLDAPSHPVLERFTREAARLLKVPVALVSLVDGNRQFFQCAVGLPDPWATRRETPLSHSFCQHVVAMEGPLVVDDASAHPLVAENLARRDLGVEAYAGVPITLRGLVIGSLCAIDTAPRSWSRDEVDLLRGLGEALNRELKIRVREGEGAEEAGRRRRDAGAAQHEGPDEDADEEEMRLFRQAFKGEDKLMRSLVRIFLEDAPGLLDALESAMNRGDLRSVESEVHRLSGAALVIGARRFAERVRGLEGVPALAGEAGERFRELRADYEDLARRYAPLRQ